MQKIKQDFAFYTTEFPMRPRIPRLKSFNWISTQTQTQTLL